MKKQISFKLFILVSLSILINNLSFSQTYKIVDPGQTKCYNDSLVITCPSTGQAFFGQDAQYVTNPNNYTLGTDSKTVYDNNTQLTWMRSPNMTNTPPVKIDRMSIHAAYNWVATVNAANYGGFNDWRIPNVKELYSLYCGFGTDPGGSNTISASALTPFIDTNYFKFAYGIVANGERLIDQQYMSTNIFILDPSESGHAKDFGVNFSDGRIKGYDTVDVLSNLTKTFYVQLVRGATTYGVNNFVDNADSTISDIATGLMWSKYDNGSGMNWENALNWVQAKNAANYLGYNDWRMPNIKELHSIVDYSHAPDYDSLPAINVNFFHCSSIINEAGKDDFPYYWSSTTHAGYTTTNNGGGDANYIAFGRALGWPTTKTYWVDVHGAGAQRSDPKIGPPYSYATIHKDTVGGIVYTGNSHGPQGDAIRGSNYTRLVRNITNNTGINDGKNTDFINVYPNPAKDKFTITFNNNKHKVSIEMYNSFGCKVKELQTNNTRSINININDLPNGIYYIRINTDNVVFTYKLIKD